MKKINETVLNMIVPAVVFLGIMAILAGGALFGKIGRRMEVSGEDFSQMEDTRMVEALCDREEPTIQFVGKKRWSVGEVISIPTVFQAEDAEGNEVGVTVMDIMNEEGVSVMGCYQQQANQAAFLRRGVYTFSLAAMDGQRKVCKEKVSVLVDER